jgi:hypothetical protein
MKVSFQRDRALHWVSTLDIHSLLQQCPSHWDDSWDSYQIPYIRIIDVKHHIFEAHYIFSFLLSYYCCTGRTLWHLQRFLQYIIFVLTPSITLYPPSPHFWNSFNSSHFSTFICEYTTVPSYSPSYTLSLYPSSHWYKLQTGPV